MLALAAAFDGAFYLAGGTDLVSANGKAERRPRADAYRYTPAGGWKRIADLPAALVGVPSPAPTDARGFFALGGDDGTQAAPPDRHRGFRTAVLHYDAARDAWAEVGEVPAPRVTTPCVRWNDWWVMPSGEVRPGVRSPEVWRATSFAKK
jgi:N-acetylneuraminic acid mutarotase